MRHTAIRVGLLQNAPLRACTQNYRWDWTLFAAFGFHSYMFEAAAEKILRDFLTPIAPFGHLYHLFLNDEDDFFLSLKF